MPGTEDFDALNIESAQTANEQSEEVDVAVLDIEEEVEETADEIEAALEEETDEEVAE